MKISLTDTFCKNITSKGAAQLDAFDAMTPGLALRVAKSGKKSWTFMFTVPGSAERARLALGTYPATSLQDARTRATEARSKAEAGIDPRLVLAMARPKTMAQLVEERLALEVRGKLRRDWQVEARMNSYILPAIGHVTVQDFQIDPHYNGIIDPLMKRGKTRMAGVLFADLRALMNFAIRRGAIKYNPLAVVKRPDVYVPRERYLSCDEIRTVWNELPAAMMKSPMTVTILRLCLVTGQRLSEVVGIRRSELDWGRREWTIPKHRSKNKHEHVVPLSDLAIELLRSVRTNTDHFFPNKDDTGPWAILRVEENIRRTFRDRTAKCQRKLAMPAWTPHDLRRTVATQMLWRENGLGIPSMNVSHVLNHRTATKATVTQAVYDKNEYLDEKREALDKWGAFLARLVGADQMREAA